MVYHAIHYEQRFRVNRSLRLFNSTINMYAIMEEPRKRPQFSAVFSSPPFYTFPFESADPKNSNKLHGLCLGKQYEQKYIRQLKTTDGWNWVIYINKYWHMHKKLFYTLIHLLTVLEYTYTNGPRKAIQNSYFIQFLFSHKIYLASFFFIQTKLFDYQNNLNMKKVELTVKRNTAPNQCQPSYIEINY